MKRCVVCRRRCLTNGVVASGLTYCRRCAGIMMSLYAVVTGQERHDMVRECIAETARRKAEWKREGLAP